MTYERNQRRMAVRGFLSSDVLEITGTTYRRLDYWRRKGACGPEAGVGKGRGRSWSAQEIERMVVIDHLRKMGLSLE